MSSNKAKKSAKSAKQNAKQNDNTSVMHNESLREELAETLHTFAADQISKATDKNYESIAATAKLCERLAHAIYHDMPRALKRCEKATRSLKLPNNVRDYLRARFASLSRI
jgi:hypothetical protein